MAGVIIFGTRPEVIKLIPIIRRLPRKAIRIISTQQHEAIIKEIMFENNIDIDYALTYKEFDNINFHLAYYLEKLQEIFDRERFDFVMTQGDTLSAYAGMLTAYLNQVDYVYVESGLRTNDIYSPFPEEGLRKMMSHVAVMNFVPTDVERKYLEAEKVDSSKISVVGNTSIDYLVENINNAYVSKSERLILLTVHRRENWMYLETFFKEIIEFARKYRDIKIVYPVHTNKKIQQLAHSLLMNQQNIVLLPPLKSNDFYNFLFKAELVITDSGGVQEEATYLNKKIIVIRDKTERIFLSDNIARLSINDKDLVPTIHKLFIKVNETSKPNTYYGDGKSAQRIAQWLVKEYF